MLVRGFELLHQAVTPGACVLFSASIPARGFPARSIPARGTARPASKRGMRTNAAPVRSYREGVGGGGGSRKTRHVPPPSRILVAEKRRRELPAGIAAGTVLCTAR